MNAAIAAFLEGREPDAVESVLWGGTIELTVSCYLTDVLPPLDFVTSARGIVLTDDGLAVCTNPDATHIFPGGRREPGESLYETLEREISEETGCAVIDARMIGVFHLHHENARPAHWTGPYPDFLHVLYAVKGMRSGGDVVDPDGYETVAFHPVDAVSTQLRPGERVFLRAALAAMDEPIALDER